MTDAERQARRRKKLAREKKVEQHATKQRRREVRERELADKTIAAGQALRQTVYGVSTSTRRGAGSLGRVKPAWTGRPTITTRPFLLRQQHEEYASV